VNCCAHTQLVHGRNGCEIEGCLCRQVPQYLRDPLHVRVAEGRASPEAAIAFAIESLCDLFERINKDNPAFSREVLSRPKPLDGEKPHEFLVRLVPQVCDYEEMVRQRDHAVRERDRARTERDAARDEAYRATCHVSQMGAKYHRVVALKARLQDLLAEIERMEKE
jgi:hypothetical protein